jgi:hypothetical protein
MPKTAYILAKAVGDVMEAIHLETASFWVRCLKLKNACWHCRLMLVMPAQWFTVSKEIKWPVRVFGGKCVWGFCDVFPSIQSTLPIDRLQSVRYFVHGMSIW